MRKGYFAVGPALYERISPQAELIGGAVRWLIDRRNTDGTWGGPDTLDRFITTNHAVMSLLAVGLTHKSSILTAAVEYLVNLDTDNNVSFFWRSGALLNISDYQSTVKHDMEHMWRFRRRVGVHKDYPVPFFLLKLLRFADPTPTLPFSVDDVLQWILDEWDSEQCWYGRTSITSMALALIHDLDFPKKDEILLRSRNFLIDQYHEETDGSGMYHPNLVDDCFTVYNLCERQYIDLPEASKLNGQIAGVVKRIDRECKDRDHWDSGPPFGGNISPLLYPTAVSIRALLSYHMRSDETLLVQVGAVVMDQQTSSSSVDLLRSAEPFWGPIPKGPDTRKCFVLMPFDKKLTEIYERYVKKPITEQTSLTCFRADDIFAPRKIMSDIWKEIALATVLVADLTTRNPNVLYELGMAHTLGRRVILISQDIADVPFDLRAIRVIIYQDSPTGYEKLAQDLIKYFKDFGLA